MPNTGKPSRGCELCRQRHIKCDEREPSCSYCLKRRIRCSGPRSVFDVAWKDQNNVAARNVQRRENAAKTGLTLKRSEDQAVWLTPKLLPQDIQAYALDFFFSHYISSRPLEDQRSVLDCLLPVWGSTNPTSPLVPAVTAVSLALLEAWSFVKPDQPLSLSRSQHLRALSALKGALASSNNNRDDIIVAALMLDMFESLQVFWGLAARKGSHVDGAVALLRSRRQLAVHDSTSKSVLAAASVQIVSRAISNGLPVPEEVENIWKATSITLHSPASALERLTIDLAKLEASAHAYLSQDEIAEDSVLAISKTVSELDKRFQSWRTSLPYDWLPVRVSSGDGLPHSVLTTGVYGRYCDTYKNVYTANQLNNYYSYRIKLQLLLLACQNASLNVASRRWEAIATIQAMVDGICASIPFILGDRSTLSRIDDRSAQYPHCNQRTITTTMKEHQTSAAAFGGWFLAQRLGELLSLKAPLRDGQRQWIAAQMGRIKKIYLIQQEKYAKLVVKA